MKKPKKSKFDLKGLKDSLLEKLNAGAPDGAVFAAKTWKDGDERTVSIRATGKGSQEEKQVCIHLHDPSSHKKYTLDFSFLKNDDDFFNSLARGDYRSDVLDDASLLVLIRQFLLEKDDLSNKLLESYRVLPKTNGHLGGSGVVIDDTLW